MKIKCINVIHTINIDTVGSFVYSGTSELWTPWDLLEVSVIGRCPLYNHIESAPGNVTTLFSRHMLCA